MTYELACDSCGYAEAVTEERSAYTGARDHEAEHPEHIVMITQREADRGD